MLHQLHAPVRPTVLDTPPPDDGGAANNPPTGALTIGGAPIVGQTLQAVSTLQDADGMGTISYQWQADGNDIDGATGSSYLLTSAESGKQITVTASYTDGGGTDESVSSDSVGAADYAILERSTVVTTIAAGDKLLGAYPRYTLSGDDADLFKINSKGVLAFRAAPDQELPQDWDGDGLYQVSVQISNPTTHYTITKDMYVGVEFAPILGTPGDDNLRGTNGEDTLDGMGGNDKLTGKGGLDTFHISAGNDTITDFNLLGDDFGSEILQVEAGAKVVATLAADDWYATEASYNLGNAELRTKGVAVDLSGVTKGQGWTVTSIGKATTIVGSMFDDTLTGGAGGDHLDGGAGNDLLIGGKLATTMTGGDGADRFRLNGTKGVTTAHIITDFTSGTDRIELDLKAYKMLIAGQQADSALAYGTAAQTPNQHLIYDSASGHLWYDVDGSGKKAAVLIGVLGHDTPLKAADLWAV